MIAYYSTASGNTERFVKRLGLPCVRVSSTETISVPYVLVTPTYNGEIPSLVRSFLQVEANRSNLYGVVGTGSTNFGADYALAAKKISMELGVPLLHLFELSGLDEDVAAVQSKVEELWSREALI